MLCKTGGFPTPHLRCCAVSRTPCPRQRKEKAHRTRRWAGQEGLVTPSPTDLLLKHAPSLTTCAARMPGILTHPRRPRRRLLCKTGGFPTSHLRCCVVSRTPYPRQRKEKAHRTRRWAGQEGLVTPSPTDLLLKHAPSLTTCAARMPGILTHPRRPRRRLLCKTGGFPTSHLRCCVVSRTSYPRQRKEKAHRTRRWAFSLAGAGGLEPTTPSFGDWCSTD